MRADMDQVGVRWASDSAALKKVLADVESDIEARERAVDQRFDTERVHWCAQISPPVSQLACMVCTQRHVYQTAVTAVLARA